MILLILPYHVHFRREGAWYCEAGGDLLIICYRAIKSMRLAITCQPDEHAFLQVRTCVLLSVRVYFCLSYTQIFQHYR